MVVPKSVKQIDYDAFAKCEKLRVVVFEKDSELETIQSGAFSGCKNLVTINLPEGLKDI